MITDAIQATEQSHMQIYWDVMKTIQCAHPPHHSVCHEPISVLINAPSLVLAEHSVGSNTNIA